MPTYEAGEGGAGEEGQERGAAIVMFMHGVLTALLL